MRLCQARSASKIMRGTGPTDSALQQARLLVIGMLSEYAKAGVQRIVLNHELFDDLEMLDALAELVFPLVEG